MLGGRVGGTRRLPVLSDDGRGRPAEAVVVPAVAHVDAGRADGHADPVGLVVDGDGAKVGVEFVLVPPLGANQLTVHHQAYGGGGAEGYQSIGNSLRHRYQLGVIPVPRSDTRLRMCPGLESMLKQTSMLLLGRWTMKWGSLSTGGGTQSS